MQKKKMLKRGLCLALTFVMSVTGLPSANLLAKAQSGRDAGEGEGQEIQFEPGETRFYENLTIQDVTSSNSSVLSVTAKDEVSKALYDRTAESADNSLSCFDLETPNAQMDLSSAEFRIESKNGGYTIYNQAEGKYIVNGSSEVDLFSQEPGVCSLEKVEENGAVSFKIARVADDNNGRAMYFDSKRMGFWLWGPPVAEASNRDFKLELLEKQAAPSAGDPIPGYRRASEITSGKNYLVTEFYHDSASNEDVIIILYAKDDLARTKLCREDRTVGVMVEAVGIAGQTADLTVQGSVSKVTIVQCKHVFGEWEMTVEPTADADGQRKRVCSRCNQEEIETIDRNAYISGSLADKIQEAQACNERAYTAESYAKLQEALRNAQQLAANASNADKLAAISAIRQALEGLERVADDIVTGIKPTVRDSSKKNYFKYTGGWIVSDSEAYIDLGASDPNAEQNYYELYFEGNKVNIFAVKQPNHGKVRFSVDNAEETTVDLYNAENIGAVSVYEISGLSEGPHVLKAVTLNEKSGGKVVNQIAYAEVTHLPYSGGTPNLGGAIVDTDTQWTQDRFGEVAASTKKTAELSAWKNDKAISEIALISKDCSLDDVTVTAGALTSGQNTIGAEHVKTTFIKSTKAYNGGYLGYGDPNREIPPATTGNRSESSDILYQEGGSMNMQYESVLPVWVEFEIPEDAAAGTYTGTLTATAKGIDTPLTFTYTVNVQDITLPDAGTYKDTFDIELWQYPYSSAEYYDVEPFSEEHLDIMRSSMQIYKELGGHAITASIVEEAWAGQTYSKNDVHYPSMVKWTKSGDGFQYDWTDFDKWVSFCIDMGLGDKIVLYSIAPWHNSFTYWENGELKKEGFTAGSDRYRAVWGDFLRELISHLEDKGWFDRSYIGIDERGFSAAAFDMVDSVTNSKGEPLKTAGAMDGFVDKKDLAMRVDDLNVGDNAAAEHAQEFAALLKERQEAGLRTTLYSCTEHKPGNFALSAPVESYWGMVNAAKMGTAGFLRWAYDAWVEDPLRDATHNAFEPGDCFLIYPDEKDAANPASKRSVRLERMAEGVRDVNKLMYLEKEMPALADEIQSLYDGITTTASGGGYLSAAEKTALAEQMNAFKAGVGRLTDNYTRFMAAEEPGLYLMGSEKEMKVGQKYTIQAKLVTDQADKTITYRSSDPSVAYVDASGMVTARSLGETQITLTAAGFTASVDVTVTEKTLIIKNTLTDYKLPEEYLSDVYKGDPDAGRPSNVKDNYLGQPDMIMLDDNQTLITVFPAGHGRGRIIMMKSRDAGETWEQQTVPNSWLDSFETPTIYKLNMTDGTTKLIVISGRPSSFGAPTGGWDTSISDDNGETWSEFETFQEGPFTDDAKNTVVAMASLVQLKDGDGNYIDKWMGVYHNGGTFKNYKTYLTFDENGNQQWTDPVPYLSEYRDIENSHQICEVGMFRSPDEKRIVALARSQTHSHPATMFYSDDEGETWSKPVDLPGSLAGERHKAMYDPSDPTGQRMIVTFREIQYDKNNNNRFDGDWMAGDWIGWVGTYDQLMNLEDGMYRVLLCEDWAANAKSGDTGYTGIVAQPDGTFIMDSYGHWDKEYSESLDPYNVYNDWCWIKQAKFKLSVFDEQFAPVMAGQLQEEVDSAPADWKRSKYSEESFDRMKAARDAAKTLLDGQDQTQAQYGEALRQLQKMKSRLTMKGVEKEESLVTGITVTPDRLVISKVGAAGKLNAAVAPADATDKEILWKSDRPDVVAVSNKGAVMALKEGSAQITATAADGSGISKTAVVIVGATKAVTGVTIAEQNFALEVGKTKKLTANVAPADASDRRVSWESADATVATVSPDGTVTARKEGTAKITVTTADGSKTAEVTVTVTPRSAESIERDEAKQAWADALEEADKIDVASGPSMYSDATWRAFKSAYDELKALTDEQIEAMTPAALKTKVKALTDAQKALKDEAKQERTDALEEAEKINMTSGSSMYSAKTWRAFKSAYDGLKGLTDAQVEAMTSDALKVKVKKLTDAQKALKDEAKQERTAALKEAEKIDMASGSSKYPAAIWTPFKSAYDELKGLTEEQIEAMTPDDLKAKVKALTDAQKPIKKEEAKRERTDALEEAEKIDMESGPSMYSVMTWTPFKSAYDELKGLTDEEIEAMTPEALKAKVKALTDAQKALKNEAKRERADALKEAEKIDMESGSSKYTAETWTPFKSAYDELKGLTEEQIEAMTPDDLKEKVKALTDAQNVLEPIESGSDEQEKEEAKRERTAALEEAEKIDMASGSSKYTAETWTPFKSAYDELKGLTEEQMEAMTPEALKKKVKALTDAQKALKLIGSGSDEQEKEEAKRERTAALEEAEKIDMESGSSKYTAATWTPFKAAYDELKGLTEEQIEAMTPEALKEKVQALTEAQNALKLIGSGSDEQETEQAKKQLEKKLEEVADIYGAGERSYTSDSWNAFKEAYEAAQSPADNLSLEELKALAARLEETKNALALSSEKTAEIEKVAADTGKEILAGNKNNYKKDAWEKYTAAYNALKTANANKAGAAELIRLQNELAKAKKALTVDKGWIAAKKALTDALKNAKAIYDSRNANSKYTADSWKKFSDAYVAANRKAAATVMNSDAANLRTLAGSLNTARLRLAEAPKLQAGNFIEKEGVRYTVVDATQKTVKAAGISSQKKKLTKINIPPTVEIKNTTCRVTEIDKNAFRKFTKLKTVKLGANVTKIGKQAFDGCTAMKDLSMGATEKMAFETKAFSNCKKLKKITFKTKKVPVFKKTVFTKLPANPKVTLGKMKAKDKKTMKAKLKKAGLKSNKIK